MAEAFEELFGFAKWWMTSSFNYNKDWSSCKNHVWQFLQQHERNTTLNKKCKFSCRQVIFAGINLFEGYQVDSTIKNSWAFFIYQRWI